MPLYKVLKKIIFNFASSDYFEWYIALLQFYFMHVVSYPVIYSFLKYFQFCTKFCVNFQALYIMIIYFPTSSMTPETVLPDILTRLETIPGFTALTEEQKGIVSRALMGILGTRMGAIEMVSGMLSDQRVMHQQIVEYIGKNYFQDFLSWNEIRRAIFTAGGIMKSL